MPPPVKRIRSTEVRVKLLELKSTPASRESVSESPPPALMFILADEPVSNLDTYYAGRVMGLFRNLTSQNGKIVMCALHDPQLISRFADFALSLNPAHPEGWNLREVQKKHEA